MFMHPTGAGSGHESEMIYAPLALSAGLFILVIPSSTASAQGSSSKSDGGKSSELSSILKALGLESKRRGESNGISPPILPYESTGVGVGVLDGGSAPLSSMSPQ
ncbi:hypothetical protein ACGC1H_002683 [Rhizoctonia solani]